MSLVRNNKDSAINRDTFIDKIKTFKRSSGNKTIKEICTTPVLLQLFLKDTIIRSYLTRDARQVEFQGDNPTLDAKKDEKEKSDYYELKIYHHMGNHFIFRPDTSSANFGSDGVDNRRLFVGNFFKSIIDDYNSDDLIVTPQLDIYKARHFLNKYTFKLDNATSEKRVRFIITPVWKDNHAIFMLHIADLTTRRILASVFINSWDKKRYYEYLELRFNNINYYNYPVESAPDSTKKYLSDTFGIDIKNKSLIKQFQQPDKFTPMNIETKIGYATNRKTAIRLYREEKCEALFLFEDKDDAELRVMRKVPWIDSSHSLQTGSGDKDCALYSLNITKAVAQMLNNSDIADQVYQLAQLVDKRNSSASESLSIIFKDGLKDYLPSYYSERKAKDPKEIRQFHLQERWNIDSELLEHYYFFKI
jgi:hypothetical protein